jgi:Ni,Fe-hydrogenase I large subunit
MSGSMLDIGLYPIRNHRLSSHLRNIAISAFDPETTMYVSAVSLGSTAANRGLLEHWVASAELVILAQRVRIAPTSTDATKV